MKLKEIKTYDVKSKNYTNGSLYVNCGKIFCGVAIPDKNDNFYHFYSEHEYIFPSIRKKTLEDILIHVECSLKEFVKKITYSEKIIKKSCTSPKQS